MRPAALLLAALLPQVALAAPVTRVHYVMGTWFRIQAEGEGATRGMSACFREARRLEHVFSRFDATSELSSLNDHGGGAAGVSDDMRALLARSLALRAATDGAFDVSVGALTALWRSEPAPSPVALATARATLGAVHLDGAAVTLAPGTRLDFDGVAKGWAVDACVTRLRAAGVRRALVSLGESSLYAIGAPAGADGWELAVRGTDPDTVVGWLSLRDQGASVSATYGSAGRIAARGVSHIIDPHTGAPLTDDAVAVAVAASATDAEAYTKAMLIWGVPGMTRARRLGAATLVFATPQGTKASGTGFRALPHPRPIAASEEPLG